MKKRHRRLVDATAKEGYVVSLGRPLSTMGHGVRSVSTIVEGRSIWCYFGETCGYHSRLVWC